MTSLRNKNDEPSSSNLKEDHGGIGDCSSDDIQIILDCVEQCPAVFRSEQIGDPELTVSEKRNIAEYLLHNKPSDFLRKFGKFLSENHLNYFLQKYESSYEVQYYAKAFKASLSESYRNIIIKNRRYEALKRMEATGNYFSEKEMEKREPLLYHEMVGQYLNEQEKLKKNRLYCKNVIPTFSNFLLDKLEKEELNELLLLKQGQGQCDPNELLPGENSLLHSFQGQKYGQKWGVDWDDEAADRLQRFTAVNNLKVELLNSQEKDILFQEFKAIMQNNFLNGKDTDFNYSDVDSNPDYDCLEILSQDEEEKYFDEESSDCSNQCTDTGIEDY